MSSTNDSDKHDLWIRKSNPLRANLLRILSTTAIMAMAGPHCRAQTTYEPYTFTTFAGGGGFAGLDDMGTAVRFSGPTDVAVDSAGNVYVADSLNHAIRKVTPAGVVTTLAGLAGSYGSEDGTGSNARFTGFHGMGVGIDNNGNVYVGDTSNNTIRKVTPTGLVTTLAGRAGFVGSANGIGSAVRFNSPWGPAVDSEGSLYVADEHNHTIRKMTRVGTNWVVVTIAGSAGNLGKADGTNQAARFRYPRCLTIDPVGNLYVADPGNHTVRKVTPAGTNWVVTTLAGNALILDPSGNPLGGHADGAGNAARFNFPSGIAVDRAGNLYVADRGNCAIRQLTLIGANWVVTTLAGTAWKPGSADGVGASARFNFPFALAVDSGGTLYVADTSNDAIRKVTPDGTNWVVTTLAAVGDNHGTTDETGLAARFKGPSGVALDNAGNAYIADQINHTIRKVSATGEITTLAGLAGYSGSTNRAGSEARFNSPSSLAVDGAGNVYVADSANNQIRKIARIGTNWVVTTMAGQSGFDDPLFSEGDADGIGNAARFTFPKGVAVDSAGNVYVADTVNSTIRKVTPAGRVTTLAGTAGVWGSKDATGSAAEFYWPSGVAVDSATNLYVADTYNHTIRRVTPARVVTTVAGLGGSAGSADGTGNAARFNFPSAIAVDTAGNVYVADTYNNTIRKLTPIGTNWLVKTLGGMAGFYGTANGTGGAARFSNPSGIAVDGVGTLYVADFYFNTIRKGYPQPNILNPAFVSGQFHFDLASPPGLSVIVEASPDLVAWLPIWTNTSSGTLNFSDSQTGVSSHRFYRSRLP